MDQKIKLGIGAVLMTLGVAAVFTPLFGITVPLKSIVIGVGVLALSLGTLLVGISSIDEGEHTV